MPRQIPSVFLAPLIPYVQKMSDLRGLALSREQVIEHATVIAEGLEEDTAERWEHLTRTGGDKLARTYHDPYVREIVHALRADR